MSDFFPDSFETGNEKEKSKTKAQTRPRRRKEKTSQKEVASLDDNKVEVYTGPVSSRKILLWALVIFAIFILVLIVVTSFIVSAAGREGNPNNINVPPTQYPPVLSVLPSPAVMNPGAIMFSPNFAY